MRISSLASLLFATTACATAPPPFTVSALGGEGTLRCAATELRAAGYEVDASDTSAEASRVQQLAPAEAQRDVYSPSLHDVPVNRQQVQPVSVDEETSTQVRRIMRSCRTP